MTHPAPSPQRPQAPADAPPAGTVGAQQEADTGRDRLRQALDAARQGTAANEQAVAGPMGGRALTVLRQAPRLALRAPILLYRYTLSSFMGRQCRYLPTCSEYADAAIARHGAWAGAWMATARLCRCHPWGGHGYDPAPEAPPPAGRWYAPWRYGIWRMTADPAAGPAPSLLEEAPEEPQAGRPPADPPPPAGPAGRMPRRG